MLEAAQHRVNAFVTLTYSDQNLPTTSALLPTLAPEHLRNFLKILRRKFEPERFRFFAVGEYGDETFRPHYHLALFGFPSCNLLRTRRRVGSGRPLWDDCCAVCALVGKSWGFGDVDLGLLEADSAAYIGGYVTKKMTRFDDPRLDGRHPEFARMSLRPGIGHSAMHDVADRLLYYKLDASLPDVPSTLRHGQKELPLGRYLTRTLRSMIGREPAAPKAVLDKIAAEMSPLQVAARTDPKAPSLKWQVLKKNEAARARLLARSKIYKGRKSL